MNTAATTYSHDTQLVGNRIAARTRLTDDSSTKEFNQPVAWIIKRASTKAAPKFTHAERVNTKGHLGNICQSSLPHTYFLQGSFATIKSTRIMGPEAMEPWDVVVRPEPDLDSLALEHARAVLAEALQCKDAEKRINRLRILMRRIEQAFAEGNVAFVDQLLGQFDPSSFGRLASIGILRSTFRAKSSLDNWQGCMLRVAGFLESNGDNIRKTLRGLINFDDKSQFTSQPQVL